MLFMPLTQIVNINDSEDWDVYIGRPSIFGNPYKVGKYSREEAISRFDAYFTMRVLTDEDFRATVLDLKGKRLACFCKPLPCHGDIIKEYLDKENKEL